MLQLNENLNDLNHYNIYFDNFFTSKCLLLHLLEKDTPSHCICGKSFTVEHAFSCHLGGYPTLCDNEIRNFTANLLSEVCHNVTIEPTLQPVTRETFKLASAITDIGARSDLSANGFCGGHFEKNFFMSEFLTHLLHLTPHQHPLLATANMKKKKRATHHGHRARLLHPHSKSHYWWNVANQLSSKWNSPYSQTIGWLRCCMSFSNLRSSILCIRGARSS